MARLGQITDKDRPYEHNGRMYSGGIDIGPATGSSNTSSDPDAGLSMAEYGAKYGVSIPSGGSGASGKGSYKVTGVDKPSRTGYLRSAKELADLYDINYDMDAIKKIYDDATNAKYALLSKELEQGENDFYTNNANANATLLDTLRNATSSAIATGASRGIAGAEQLGLMMEQQQAITDEATNLAQERANMADKIAAEKAENIINALEYSDNLKKTLGNLSSNIYSADTQYDVGLLDWAAQMKNVEALFEQIGAEERANLAALLSNEKIAQAQREHEAAEGAANRKAQKEMNDATIAGNKEAARIQAAGYRAGASAGGGYTGYGSGSGGYYNNNGALDYNKIWAAGDVPMMIQYLTNYEKMSYAEAMSRINSDRQFMANATQGGYSNAINYAEAYDKAVKEGDLQTIYALRDIGNGTGFWSDIGNFFGTAVSNPDAISNAGTNTIKNTLTAIFGGGPNQQTLEAAVKTWSKGKLTNTQKEQLVKTLGIPRHTIEGMVETYKKQNKK